MKCWQTAIKIKLLCCVLVTFGLLNSITTTARAQIFSFDDKRQQDGLTFDLIQNLIIVSVTINDQGPFNFVLDTGVGPMIITNPKLIEILKLTELRPIKMVGFGAGEEIDAYVSKNESTRISLATAKNVQTIVLKEDLFNLSAYVGKEISGLIGFDFFNSFVVKINYPLRKLQFSLPNKKSRYIRGEKIPIEIIDSKPYLNATMESEKLGKINVKLIVDCGASHALSLEKYIDGEFPMPAAHILGNLGVGLSGEISGNIGRTVSLSIGPFLFKDVLTNFPKYSEVAAKATLKERNGNLGAEILNRFDVTFDYQNKAMYLKKNEAFKRPFEHDMAGMEVYMGLKGYGDYLLGRIEPDSPAEKAGFQERDELLSINFKRIEEYTLDQISNLFKSGNGRTVVVEVLRDNVIIVKLLRLKKRV
jgi:hypothetical protein